jgi:hypothetical protein
MSRILVVISVWHRHKPVSHSLCNNPLTFPHTFFLCCCERGTPLPDCVARSSLMTRQVRVNIVCWGVSVRTDGQAGAGIATSGVLFLTRRSCACVSHFFLIYLRFRSHRTNQLSGNKWRDLCGWLFHLCRSHILLLMCSLLKCRSGYR